MARYKALLFWMGGVLTEKLMNLTLSVAQPTDRGKNFVAYRQKLKQHTSELMLGTLTPQAYCQLVVQECQSEMNEHQLEDTLMKRIHLRSAVVEIIKKIPEEYDRWLISDYPLKWFEMVSDSLNFPALFPSERVIFTANMRFADIESGISDQLLAAAGQTMSNCLMVDGNSARAVGGVKRGLASIIYVYPDRLKHELALQKILQINSDVLHPNSSGRVNIP